MPWSSPSTPQPLLRPDAFRGASRALRFPVQAGFAAYSHTVRMPRLTRRRRDDDAPRGRGGYVPGTWGQAAQPDVTSVILPPPEPAVTVIQPLETTSPPAELPPPLVAPPPPQAIAPPPAPLLAPSTAPAAPVTQSPTVPVSMPVPDPAIEPRTTGVRLGFADGSDLHLDPDDPHTKALKAVADVLTRRDTHTKRRWRRGG